MNEFTFVSKDGQRAARLPGGYSTRKSSDAGSGQEQFLIPFEVFENGEWRAFSLVATEQQVAELQERQIDILNDESAIRALIRVRYYSCPEAVAELPLSGKDVCAAFDAQVNT